MKNNIIKLFAIMFIINYQMINGQDMRQNSSQSLFSDFKANRIGDAITIIVMESSTASNRSEKSTNKSSDLGFNFDGTIDKSALPKIEANVGSKNGFNGGGSTKTTGVVSTKISATVDSVYENGNLRINGSRKIVINGEEQVIKIKGIVRPSDIMSDNSVLSYNISEAEIYFEGKGMITKSQSPGLLTKFFHMLF
ncbi:MAG: hypothetical protein STSR0008_15470 [Ignavibacterium sp.]